MTRLSSRPPITHRVLWGFTLCGIATASVLLGGVTPKANKPSHKTNWGIPLATQHKEPSHHITARRSSEACQQVDFTLDHYAVNVVEEKGVLYSCLDNQGGVLSNREGFAELPFFHAALQLTQAQPCRLVIEEESHEDIVLDYPMLPSKGVIYRNEDPRTIERVIAPESLKGEWFPTTIADITDPFIFRDVHGVNVFLRPFQYDAATRTLRITTRMVVRVETMGEPLVRESTRSRKITAEMEPIYQSLFLNYTSLTKERWSHEVAELGDILVIHTARDASAIQPYVQWKREKGHHVKVVQVATGTKVENLIKDEYAANPNLLYVQLVGDWADIKSETGTSENKPMDPLLGCVAGIDFYPDLIIGRFSANSANDVTAQVNKTINYEQNPDASGTWYKKGLVIASSEGIGEGDDGESDIQHETNIRNERLLRTTYSSVAEAFGSSSTKAMISTPINDGLGVINYTGHGSVESWITTGFNNHDVSELTNGSMLPVICSVACMSGAFDNDCFAEAWLRKADGGALAGMFSTINQPWIPPMRGQDYFNDLLTGGYDYTASPGNGISTTGGRSTFGSLAVNATVLMFAESSQADDLETLQTWTTFGDASVQVRTNTPKSILLSNQTVVPGTAFTTRVTANGAGVTKALVSLSRGEHVISGLTDYDGVVTLNHDLNAGAAKLVVTGRNTTTIMQPIDIGQTNQDVSVAIYPTVATLDDAVSYQFNATITGTTNDGVTWTCTGGTISASGQYVSPSSGGTYTVKASSVADPTRYATATVMVTPKPPVSVAISPASANLYTNATKQFTATVINSSDTSVTWSCSAGTISHEGLYTAPKTAGTYIVKATSNADPRKSASVNVTVIPETLLVSIDPPFATLTPGGTKQFTATVTGATTNPSITWTCTAGTITSSGLFTAPSTGGSCSIKATSAADTSKFASATISVFGIDSKTYQEVESNDSLSTSNLVPDKATKILGTISSSTDMDYFQVNVGAGEKLQVNMVGPAKNYDLYLTDRSNTLLTKSTLAASSESLSYVNRGTETITTFIHVEAYSPSDYSVDEPYGLILRRSMPSRK